jgi:hypothetical protein
MKILPKDVLLYLCNKDHREGIVFETTVDKTSTSPFVEENYPAVLAHCPCSHDFKSYSKSVRPSCQAFAMVVGVFMVLKTKIPKAGKRGDVDIYQYTKFSASLELCKCQ